MTEGFLEVYKDRHICAISARLYEQWKRKDLLAIALETMPKQVRKNFDSFTKLRIECAKKLTDRSTRV